MRRFALIASASIALVVACASCGFLKSLVGKNTVDLSKAEVKSMGVDLRRKQKTICPREPVQMAVFAEVVLEGDKQPKSFETWQGRGGVNKNDKLDFADFAFRSDFGTFDEDGWFTPVPDLRATTARELLVTTAYRGRPDKFTFKTKYKPDYTCIQTGGRAGRTGSNGSTGGSGSAGGSGGNGGPGSNGGNGTDGEPGPQLAVRAAIVKTPFYPKLVAVRIEGAVDDFLLFALEQTFALRAAGGPGGSGGPGGGGGAGGRGMDGKPGGRGGNGGPGGNGGHGGNGGPGGQVELVYDSRFPELARALEIDVSGGPGGPGGAGGSGGPGGSGGTGLQGTAMGSSGSSGPSGGAGARGNDGPQGRVRSSAGETARAFAGLDGVEVL